MAITFNYEEVRYRTIRKKVEFTDAMRQDFIEWCGTHGVEFERELTLNDIKAIFDGEDEFDKTYDWYISANVKYEMTPNGMLYDYLRDLLDYTDSYYDDDEYDYSEMEIIE